MNSSSLPKEAVTSLQKVAIGAVEWKEIKPQIMFPKKKVFGSFEIDNALS
jgi:hypothetical protein